MCNHGILTYRCSSCAVAAIFGPPQTPRCLLEKEPYFCRILLEKKPLQFRESTNCCHPICVFSHEPANTNTYMSYILYPWHTLPLTYLHKSIILCMYVLLYIIKPTRRNLCVLQDIKCLKDTVSHKIRLRLMRHNHYSLVPTHAAVVVVAYYNMLIFNPHLVCTPFMGRAQSPEFTFRRDRDLISGIPSLGPYTDPEIEMSPYTATRQLLLPCVLIDAHQKRKKARQHTQMRVTPVPHTQTHT